MKCQTLFSLKIIKKDPLIVICYNLLGTLTGQKKRRKTFFDDKLYSYNYTLHLMTAAQMWGGDNYPHIIMVKPHFSQVGQHFLLIYMNINPCPAEPGYVQPLQTV